MRIVQKPWGREEIFAENERYAGKLLHLSAGHSLSLQMHHRRSEHWVVVAGITVFGCFAALVCLRNYRARVAYWV